MFDFVVVDESIHLGGSFKIRGIAPWFSKDIRRLLKSPLVSFSSGNHGIATTLLANDIGGKSIVIVPDWIEPEKKRL